MRGFANIALYRTQDDQNKEGEGRALVTRKIKWKEYRNLINPGGRRPLWHSCGNNTKSHIKKTSVRRWFVFNWCRETSSGLGNEELCGHYSSPNVIRGIQSRRMRGAGHVTFMGERSGAYGVLVGKPEWQRPLRRPGRRWQDNIKIDLQEVGWSWIFLA